MKILRSITIDLEVFQILKERNVRISTLVNELLLEWIDKQKPKSREERIKELRKKEIELEALEKIAQLG